MSTDDGDVPAAPAAVHYSQEYLPGPSRAYSAHGSPALESNITARPESRLRALLPITGRRPAVTTT